MMTQLTEMKTSIIPSVLLSETHFAYCRRKDCIGDAVARVADDGFYGGVEIADIPDASERERIGSVVQAYGLRLIQWMSMVLVTENLNLSSLDESLRKQTVARMKGLTDQAAQCTASGFAVLSGPDPGPQLRKDATEQLYKSMCELAEALKQYHPMALILEPLDRDAHKNGLLGPTREVVELMARLRRQFPNVGVSWDTAHVALCDEDILQSFKTAHSYIRQIHLADAVLDRNNPRFGDHHMHFGSGGFLSTNKLASVFRTADELQLLKSPHLSVSVEVRCDENEDPWETERHGRAVLTEAWNAFQEGNTRP